MDCDREVIKKLREEYAEEWSQRRIAFQHDLVLAERREMFRWHSIAHKRLVQDADSPYFPYRPPQLTQAPQAPREEHGPYVAFFQAVPQDGRINLPFDFHWWRTHKVLERKILACIYREKYYRDTAKDAEFLVARRPLVEEMEAGEASALEALKPYKIPPLESFFGQDFQSHGVFSVHDVDPSTMASVVFSTESTMARVFSTEYSHSVHATVKKPTYNQCKGNSRDIEKTTIKQADIFNWMATQEMFCSVNPSIRGIAPWRRIIYCEGLELTSKLTKLNSRLPFLDFRPHLFGSTDPVLEVPQSYLAGECRGGTESANPYDVPTRAFHLVFFERVMDQRLCYCLEKRDDLRLGYLYRTPRGKENMSKLDFAFRRSCFTVTGANSRPPEPETSGRVFETACFWTILILSPPFFSRNSRFAAEEGEIDTRPTSRQTAELACIVYALRKIAKKWQEFDDYIESLLTEDFMDPAQYCQLLFDDAKFSRSRLYFWTLGCLNEFDGILEDNILQWKLYQIARIDPILCSSLVPDETVPLAPNEAVPSASAGKVPSCVFDVKDDRIRLRKLNELAQKLVSDLEALRKRFKAKKDRVQILRDGLFNASALMESRSSTRLGMNVQLLTYVSIFYLPLAFCAALWAIPSITSPHTQIAFVVTAVLVALATYMTVFNLENIVRLPWYLYSKLKNLILRAMVTDSESAWQERADRFEVFPPNQGEGMPSEWWVLWYWMIRPLETTRILGQATCVLKIRRQWLRIREWWRLSYPKWKGFLHDRYVGLGKRVSRPNVAEGDLSTRRTGEQSA